MARLKHFSFFPESWEPGKHVVSEATTCSVETLNESIE